MSSELCDDNIYKHTCSRKTLYIIYPIYLPTSLQCSSSLRERWSLNCYYSCTSALSTQCLHNIMYSFATNSIIVYLLFYRMDTLHSLWLVIMVTQAL